ncbi:MAG: hypothetical protein LBH85_00890 [Treponema sp.]|jgi:hypothetical protein|nr:hypothetical protein [Treponema sp.]
MTTSDGQVAEGFLSGGNVNDIEAAPELVRDAVGRAATAGRGYDSDEFRRILRGNNNEPAMPGRKNRKKPIEYDQKMY